MRNNALALSDPTSPAYAKWRDNTRRGYRKYIEQLNASLDEQWRAAEQEHTP